MKQSRSSSAKHRIHLLPHESQASNNDDALASLFDIIEVSGQSQASKDKLYGTSTKTVSWTLGPSLLCLCQVGLKSSGLLPN